MQVIRHRLLQAVSPLFLRSIAEAMDASFQEAARIAGQHVERPEMPNMLGQLRHARCEAGFRSAGHAAGLTVVANDTEPKGGVYSIVHNDGVYLIRGNIQKHCGPPRPTHFRREWAGINAWLSPLQIDLWKPTEPPPTDRLCAMLITTVPNRDRDQSLPAFVGIGVPHDDLSGWHLLESVTNLLKHAHDRDAAVRAPIPAPISLRDMVRPKIKKNQKGNE